MKKNNIPYIIGASSIALILLIGIQVQWMNQSKKLIEEQFDQKVNMALCRAIEEAKDSDPNAGVFLNCRSVDESDLDCNEQISSFISSLKMEDQISQSLSLYKIDMPFELSIKESSKSPLTEECTGKCESVYSCSLDPILQNEDVEMSINFIGKKAYVIEKMGLMLTLSIFIMLFITGVFIYANYYLIKQKRLSEKNKEFFNHMAHEFKTPLTNIGLASKMLMKRNNDPLIDIIHSENSELTTQVERILSMASLESGQFEINKEQVNVHELIQEVVYAINMQLLAKEGSVEIYGINENMTLLADRFHLANAFKNILENAIKYNDGKPFITISGNNSESNIEIRIQDNGVGIAPEKQELIFEKFYRIKEHDHQNNKGFGLGLSYVKKIINLHNGNISIISEWKKGTRFDLQFPKAV